MTVTDFRPRSDFLRALIERGFMHQCSDLETLDKALGAGRVTAYVGYDATAPSLHVGNLLSVMMLRWLQRTGHRPIVLMGGGTTKIGDPSGRDESRKLLSAEDIAANIASIRRAFEPFLEFGSRKTDALLVNNSEWLDQLEYISFLREIGRHFSVNRMLSFDSVKLRLEREQPLSFIEFNYMILQAYDYLELARRHECTLQMGGSDQWGNIINGVDLIRRVDDKAAFALTCPLITTASGAKMGKTAQGAVWLNADRLAPYDYWQFWRNTEDADVGRFLRFFTELPLAEVKRIEALQGAEINDGKKILANEATRMLHGETAARAAGETAESTFERGQAGSDLPTYGIGRAELQTGIAAFELFRRTGLVQSNSEARRMIKGGGARINDRVIESETHSISAADVTPEGYIKLSAGKKKHALVRPQD
jgi:tyrosyl-tRNA synthetase